MASSVSRGDRAVRRATSPRVMRSRKSGSQTNDSIRSAPASVRLDVWLDVACIFRTRSQAKAACEGGKVDVNGVRAKPHRELRVGERLAITTRGGNRRELLVRALAERSLPKPQARQLYEDVTPPVSSEMLAARRLDRIMRGEQSSRPSARERREIRKWKGKE